MINMVKRFTFCILKKNMLYVKEEGTFAKFTCNDQTIKCINNLIFDLLDFG